MHKHLREKPGRGCRPQIFPSGRIRQMNPAGFAGKQDPIKKIAHMMNRMAGGQDGFHRTGGGVIGAGHQLFRNRPDFLIGFGDISQNIQAALPEPGRIRQMGNPLRMDDNRRFRKMRQKITDAACMVNMNMGQAEDGQCGRHSIAATRRPTGAPSQPAPHPPANRAARYTARR